MKSPSKPIWRHPHQRNMNSIKENRHSIVLVLMQHNVVFPLKIHPLLPIAPRDQVAIQSCLHITGRYRAVGISTTITISQNPELLFAHSPIYRHNYVPRNDCNARRRPAFSQERQRTMSIDDDVVVVENDSNHVIWNDSKETSTSQHDKKTHPTPTRIQSTILACKQPFLWSSVPESQPHTQYFFVSSVDYSRRHRYPYDSLSRVCSLS